MMATHCSCGIGLVECEATRQLECPLPPQHHAARGGALCQACDAPATSVHECGRCHIYVGASCCLAGALCLHCDDDEYATGVLHS